MPDRHFYLLRHHIFFYSKFLLFCLLFFMNFQKVQAHCENTVKENICTVWKIHDYVKDEFLFLCKVDWDKNDKKHLSILKIDSHYQVYS